MFLPDLASHPLIKIRYNNENKPNIDNAITVMIGSILIVNNIINVKTDISNNKRI